MKRNLSHALLLLPIVLLLLLLLLEKPPALSPTTTVSDDAADALCRRRGGVKTPRVPYSSVPYTVKRRRSLSFSIHRDEVPIGHPTPTASLLSDPVRLFLSLYSLDDCVANQKKRRSVLLYYYSDFFFYSQSSLFAVWKIKIVRRRC